MNIAYTSISLYIRLSLPAFSVKWVSFTSMKFKLSSIEFLKIQSRDFFQILQHERRQYGDGNYLSKSSRKHPLLSQAGNSGPIVAQNYASLYLRICCESFFKLCSMIGENKEIKIVWVKFPRKPTFGPNG